MANSSKVAMSMCSYKLLFKSVRPEQHAYTKKKISVQQVVY